MNRIFGAVLVASVLATSVASTTAREFTVSGSSITRTCYLSVHVPATIVKKTNGVLVQKSAPKTIGNYAAGTVVEFTQSPAVYFETSTVKEAEHISLVPTDC